MKALGAGMPSMKFFLSTGVMVCLAGCVAPGTNFSNVELPPVVDGKQVSDGNCYVVTRINVDEIGRASRDKAYLRIKSNGLGGSFYVTGLFALPAGSWFRVVAFRPGEYRWSEMQIGDRYGIFKEDFLFQCVERQATYIGDVDLRIDWTTQKYWIGFVGRHERALSDYATNYPLLAANVPLKFALTNDPRRTAPAQ